MLLLTVVTLQIAYGGLVAGLKAGHVSYTWPQMGGALVPEALFHPGDSSWWATLTGAAPVVHWIHRWFAFVVLASVAWLMAVSRNSAVSPVARRAVHATAILVGVQIALAVSVLWFHMPLTLALLHQAVGLAIFTAALVVNHRLLRDDTGLGLAGGYSARTAATMASAPPGST